MGARSPAETRLRRGLNRKRVTRVHRIREKDIESVGRAVLVRVTVNVSFPSASGGATPLQDTFGQYADLD